MPKYFLYHERSFEEKSKALIYEFESFIACNLFHSLMDCVRDRNKSWTGDQCIWAQTCVESGVYVGGPLGGPWHKPGQTWVVVVDATCKREQKPER